MLPLTRSNLNMTQGNTGKPNGSKADVGSLEWLLNFHVGIFKFPAKNIYTNQILLIGKKKPQHLVGAAKIIFPAC